MKWLELLETHRRKVALILAMIVMILLYCSVIFFELILIYFWRSSWNDMGIILIILVILFPFLYSILSYIGCRVMHRIYRPIRENMTNLENFTINVNHEFKTSLSEIISSLQLWIEIHDEKNYAPQALKSAQKLNIVLDSLTPLIKMSNTNYRRKKTNIIQVFDDILKEVESQLEEKNIHVQTEYTKKSLYTFIDTGPLVICFQNILQNAIKYGDTDGTIVIRASENHFEIQNSGKGIKAENLEKIFERNFQEGKKSTGIGVGLSLVKRICDMYHWHIEVESTPKKHTTFKIFF